MSKLADFIEKNHGGNLSAAARSVGLPVATLRKNAMPSAHPDFRVPQARHMARYYVWSAGQVTPNDFYDLPPLPAADAAAEAAPVSDFADTMEAAA